MVERGAWRVFPLRRRPDDDLPMALEASMAQQSEQASCLNSGIDSLVGTLSPDGDLLDIAVEDKTGAVKT